MGAAGVPFDGHQERFSGFSAASVPFRGTPSALAALSDVRHFFSTNDVVMREALQTRRMAPCHAMGLREGVLREGCAPQASPARGAPQHLLTKTSGEYVYPYLEGDERVAAAGGRGTSFAAPHVAACCTSDPPTVSCVPRYARNLSPAGPVPLYWSAGGQTRAHPGGSSLFLIRPLKSIILLIFSILRFFWNRNLL